MSSEKEKEAMGDLSDEQKALRADEEGENDTHQLDSSKVKFINGGAQGTADAHVDIEGQTRLDQQFVGLTKTELMQYADDPFWVRVRYGLLISFWVAWVGMLVAAIVIIVVAPKCPPRPNLAWWNKEAIYNVYAKSFKDTDGDGKGDLKGVTNKLDYLQNTLGVKALMLSSIYKNEADPADGVDVGYDIIDFKAVDESMGTDADFEELRRIMHKRDMKLILDFIPNHSSNKHEWFNKSASRVPGYEDYYVWADAKMVGGDKNPPNNWVNMFGEPAWTYSDVRNQYYLHQYWSNQPDLNLRNPDVVREMDNVLRYWLGKKVDGFRVRRAAHLVESEDILNVELKTGSGADSNSRNLTAFQPETYELITHWREVIEDFGKDDDKQRFLAVDSKGTPEQMKGFMSYNDKPGVNLPVNHALLDLESYCDSQCVYNLVDQSMEEFTGVWPNWLLGDEDTKRVRTRVDDDLLLNAMNMLLLTLPGTATTYYGEEIGMENVDIPADKYIDRYAQLNKDDPMSRDPMRTPMQWTDDQYAGFTTGNTTWLPLPDEFSDYNVESQQAVGATMTNVQVYADLIKARSQPSLQWGITTYKVIEGSVLSYMRKAEGFNAFLVVINFGPGEPTMNLAQEWNCATKATVRANTANFQMHHVSEALSKGKVIDLDRIKLHKNEGLVLEIIPAE